MKTFIIPAIMSPYVAWAFMLQSVACTSNQMARQYGGTESIKLPCGQHVVSASWKEMELWYLTEPAGDGFEPKTYTYQEKSSYGVYEGTVLLVESACK